MGGSRILDATGVVTVADFDDWEVMIRVKGYVIIPLIERGGACIMVNVGSEEEPEEVVGCLIKFPDLDSQFDHNTGNYQALVDSDNSIVHVFFKHAIRSVIPIGTVMYLNIEVIQDQRFSRAARNGKYLLTRLNVPNIDVPVQGKVYVTAAYRTNGPRSRALASSSVTFEVNPWDLTPEHLFSDSMDKVVTLLD